MINRISLTFAFVMLWGTSLWSTPIGAGIAAPCVTASLSAYQNLGRTGCTVGPAPTFTFYNFGFASRPSLGTPQILNASDILVTPSYDPVRNSLNFSFSSNGFSVGSGQSVQYEISYVADPPPPEIIDFQLDLFTQTPVAPGLAQITTALCLDSEFSQSQCGGRTASLTVFHDGIAPKTTAITPIFSPPTVVLDIRNMISLSGGAGGSANFTSFDNRTVVTPEPATFCLIASGILAIFLRARR